MLSFLKMKIMQHKIIGCTLSCAQRYINLLYLVGVMLVSGMAYGQKNEFPFSPIKVVEIHRQENATGPCEPSISINPLKPSEMVAASVLNNVYTSGNGGKSWKKSELTSKFGVYGDPVVRYDAKGNVYYSHLANSKGKAYSSAEFLDRIVVQKSIDKGKTWNEGTYPPVNHKSDHDKQWKAIDPLNNAILMSWTEFDVYGSKDPKNKSRILFSVSNDDAEQWEPALVVSDAEGDCLDGDNTLEGAHPAVGIDGTYYLVWSWNEKIYMDVSSDKGKTWGRDIVIADQPGGWAFEVPGIGRCNGFPVIKCDHSRGPNRGSLYVQWSDQRNGTHDTDVWMIRSRDGGKSWSKPLRINDDAPGKQQFFSWMDIDQVTGSLYMVYYDRRNHDDNATDVWLSWSDDGGASFKHTRITNKPFLPVDNVFFGDYNDISACNGKIRPIWTQQNDNMLSVHTAIIDRLK
jgi:hypothetical protein